ncbi:MAG: hypothetical protein VB859_17780 [Planctomycetaceae bacterium]
MSFNMIRPVCAFASLLVLFGGEARAQFLPGAGSCYCLQPVTQTYYQTMPVTEYRQVVQTVRRPVVETKYVDQAVTEYRPVTETKTVDVPTVSYQAVTNYQTVQRPAGQWVTRFHYTSRISPCQYDSRPDIFGLINRTAYALRQAFTPSVIASREYVGGVITQQVPVTQSVAVPGTRQVSYNVTRMVAQTSTRKVAVNSVRYVDQQVTTLRPVTVMRNIPVGTRTVYSYSPYLAGGTRTVLLPTPGTISSPRSATKPRRFDAGEAEPSRSAAGIDDNRTSLQTTPAGGVTAQRLPSAVLVNGWHARRIASRTTATGPQLVFPGVRIADNQ